MHNSRCIFKGPTSTHKTTLADQTVWSALALHLSRAAIYASESEMAAVTSSVLAVLST